MDAEMKEGMMIAIPGIENLVVLFGGNASKIGVVENDDDED